MDPCPSERREDEHPKAATTDYWHSISPGALGWVQHPCGCAYTRSTDRQRDTDLCPANSYPYAAPDFDPHHRADSYPYASPDFNSHRRANTNR